MPEVFKLLALPGDGIGPEIVESALRVFEAAREGTGFEVQIETALIGGAATKATGVPLPDATLETARASDAILLGAVGTPEAAQWEPAVRPERGLLKIRKELGLFANLRPVRSDLAPEGSPLRPERGSDIDMLFVRELTGGIYFGEPRERGGEGVFRRVAPLQDLLAPVHAHVVVHIAGQSHFLHGGVPIIVVCLSLFQLGPRVLSWAVIPRVLL